MRCLYLWAMLWCALMAVSVRPASAASKVASGDIALGYGWTGEPTQTDDLAHHEQSLVGFFRLKVAPRGCGGANLELNVRHPFADNEPFHYFRGKREFKAQLNIPVPDAPGLTAFCLYQRNYSGKLNDFMVVGLRQAF